MATPRNAAPKPNGSRPPPRKRPTRAASVANRPARARPTPPYGTQPIAPPRPPRARKIRRDRLRAVTLWPLLGLVVGFVMFSPFMRVTQLVALGSQFTDEELDSAFNWDAWSGEYVWALWWHRETLLAQLNDHPRIDTARVRLALPGRIEVIFTEKERYAAIVSGESAFIIATDFTFMGVEPATRVRSTRTMIGVSPDFLFDPDGEPFDDPFPEWPPQPTSAERGRYYYAKLLQLWRWIDAEQNPPLSQVAALNLDPERGIILHYRGPGGTLHPQILLGYGPDLEHKYGQALTVYRSGRWRGANNVEIDLRFDRAVVRAISPAAEAAQYARLDWMLRENTIAPDEDLRSPGEAGTIDLETLPGFGVP